MSIEFAASLALLWAITVVVTLSQIVSTYSGFETAIHKTPATYGLYVINLAVGSILLIAYWLLSIAPSWTAGGIIGLGLPALVQSRFVVGGALGDGAWASASRGLALDLSPLYSSYASLFTRAMDAAVELLFREQVLPRVRTRFPDPKLLAKAAREAVAARNFPESDRQRHLALIDATDNGPGSPDEKTRILAKVIVRVMGVRYLMRLCELTDPPE